MVDLKKTIDTKEDMDTDDIRWIECPFEPDGTDLVKSFAVNLTTGEYYCYNCGQSGYISELPDEIQETIYYRCNRRGLYE